MNNKKPFMASDGPYLMLIAFAYMLLAQLVLSIVLVFVKSENGLELINYIGMIAFQIVFITVYLTYTKKRNLRSTYSPRNKLTIWSVLGAVGIALIAFFGFIGLAYMFENLLESIGYTSVGIETSSVLSIVLITFATVIAAPICEETIFRSALLSGIKKVRSDDVGTCFICGICFALMHINPSQTVYQFCLGSAAAYLVLKSRNVIASMIVHAMSNLLALLMSFTTVGLKVDEFYMKVSSNWLIALLLCVAFPVIATVLIWLICKGVEKVERKKLPDKFKLPPKVVWIDENTKQPVFEGEAIPVITEENRMVQRGFSPFTGEPVIVDRLELQTALMNDYFKNKGEKAGKLGKKTYETSFGIYYGLTVFLWLMTLGAGFIL